MVLIRKSLLWKLYGFSIVSDPPTICTDIVSALSNAADILKSRLIPRHEVKNYRRSRSYKKIINVIIFVSSKALRYFVGNKPNV